MPLTNQGGFARETNAALGLKGQGGPRLTPDATRTYAVSVLGGATVEGDKSGILLDGVDDYLTMNHINLSAFSAFTMELRFRRVVATIETMTIMGMWDDNAANCIAAILFNTGSNDIYCGMVNSGGGTVFAGQVMANTVEHHVAFTWDGAQAYMHVDGALVAAPNAIASVRDTPGVPFRIGCKAVSTNEFAHGTVDQIALHRIARYPAGGFVPPAVPTVDPNTVFFLPADAVNNPF